MTSFQKRIHPSSWTRNQFVAVIVGIGLVGSLSACTPTAEPALPAPTRTVDEARDATADCFVDRILTHVSTHGAVPSETVVDTFDECAAEAGYDWEQG